jgi:hypothetical protein
MRMYTTNEVCRIIGKSTTLLYNCENRGLINKLELNDKGRRKDYILEDINML